MQISKEYAGNIDAVGSSSARQVSYGATGTVTTYQNRVDFVNQTIADFLSEECGVDAAYEVRTGSDVKFLWIFGVSFLFSPASSSNYHFGFFGPFNENALNPGALNNSNGTTSGSVNYHLSSYSKLFPSNTTGTDYNFTLYFDGDPGKGFVLRIKIGTSNISNGFFFAFMKAKNIINGKNAVVWKYGNGGDSYSSGHWVNGIDINADGTMDQNSSSTTAISAYYPCLLSRTVDKTSNLGKMPLVPVQFGIYEAVNMYQRPIGFDLPIAMTTVTETQAVIEVSGRKFLVTCSDNSDYTCINLGLIEVPD